MNRGTRWTIVRVYEIVVGRQTGGAKGWLACRESDDGVHVLDESALYFAPPLGPPSARRRRGRAEAGPYARSPLPYQQLFHTPLLFT